MNKYKITYDDISSSYKTQNSLLVSAVNVLDALMYFKEKMAKGGADASKLIVTSIELV